MSTGSTTQRSFYDNLRHWLTACETQNRLHVQQLRNKYPAIIAGLCTRWLRNFSLLHAVDVSMKKEFPLVASLVGKILAKEPLSKREKRSVRVLLQRESSAIQQFCADTSTLSPLMDYAEGQGMRLLEKGIVPAWYDPTSLDRVLPDFEPIPGDVTHMHIPRAYGSLTGTVRTPPGNHAAFFTTSHWVFDMQANPMFPLEPYESVYSYAWNGRFITCDSSPKWWNNHDSHIYKLRDQTWALLHEFGSYHIQQLADDLFFLSRDYRREQGIGLFDLASKTWLLGDDYTLESRVYTPWDHDRFPIQCVLSQKSSKHFGVYDIATGSWVIPCSQQSIEQVQFSKGSEQKNQADMTDLWYVHGKGKEHALLRMDGTVVCSLPFDWSGDIDRVEVFSSYSRCRYLFTFHRSDTGDTETRIISENGADVLMASDDSLYKDETRAIFLRSWCVDEYIDIDLASGVAHFRHIPGKLTFTMLGERKWRYYVVFEENGMYGVKDLFWRTVVPPQPYRIERYHPHQYLLVSREREATRNRLNSLVTQESQLVDLSNTTVLPWSVDLESMYVVDKSTYYTNAGDILHTDQAGNRYIRKVPAYWTMVEPTGQEGVYIVRQPGDRGPDSHMLYNLRENTVFSGSIWIPYNERSCIVHTQQYSYPLSNGYTIFGSGVLDREGKVILPLGLQGMYTLPLLNNRWEDIGVMSHYRNSIMRIEWDSWKVSQ